MEGGGFAPNTMAGEGLPSMVGNVFPPITPTLLPRDVLPNINPTLLPSDGFPPITPTLLPSDALPNLTPPLFPRDVLPTITPVVVPTTIVREVLTEGNYAIWRPCIRRYLKAQGLWDICKKSCISPDRVQDRVGYLVWSKKNDMALHAIQISCSREMLYRIRDETRASEAWEYLKPIAGPTLDFDRGLSPDASDRAGNADFSQYERLRQALYHGSWNDIEFFLHSNPDAVRTRISPTGLTPLHIAASAGHVKVVENLVQYLNPEDLMLTEEIGKHTPLALAAWNGFKEIAECMIRKNPGLTSISDEDGILPVALACNQGKKEMARYLYFHTPSEELAPGKGTNGATFLSYCINSKMLDTALDILKRHPSLAVTLDANGFFPLYLLGGTPSLFNSGSQRRFWQRWIYSYKTIKGDHTSDGVLVNVVDETAHSRDGKSNIDQKGIKNMHDQASELLHTICTILKPTIVDEAIRFRVHQAVIQATKKGNVEFVIKMITSFPDQLVCYCDRDGRNIFSIAILHRQEKIFDLLHGLSDVSKKTVTSSSDMLGNNMLHLAARLAPSDQLDCISGAALQMQRELQWFKEVESIVPTVFKDLPNLDGKKPSDVFSQQHAHLVKEGDKWMKDIATSSSFVAALIVTIMFAAAFTIPGGNNDKGAPIFLEDDLFMVFIMCDSISLFSAISSVLMFLGILTSQYPENKFLMRWPTKLIIGLSTLFISIAAMMIAFCAALAILLKGSSTKVVMIPIILFACVPVTIFAVLQFPLLVNIFMSTYWPLIFNRKK